MKKMMSVKPMYAVLAAAYLFCGTLEAMPISDKDATTHELKKETSFVGEWNYSVDNAPYEYSKGILKVEKVSENYGITVKVNHSSIKGEQIKINGKKLDFVVYIEGQKVDVSLIMDADTFSGKAVSVDGVFPMKGTRNIVD